MMDDTMRYRTIVADPPWTYRSRGFPDGSGSWALTRTDGTGNERHSKVQASERYNVLSLDDICSLPVDRFAESDSYLWLWMPAEHFRYGDHWKVCEAWGFDVKGERVWKKPGIGMGYWMRYNHEMLVFATRGSPGVFRVRNLPSCIEARIQGHSVKPDRFYRDIEEACGGPYLELFARSKRPRQLELLTERVKWTVWGNETGDPLGIGFDPAQWREIDIAS